MRSSKLLGGNMPEHTPRPQSPSGEYLDTVAALREINSKLADLKESVNVGFERGNGRMNMIEADVESLKDTRSKVAWGIIASWGTGLAAIAGSVWALIKHP